MTHTAVGVAFRRVARSYYFDPAGLALHEGHRVVVDTTSGLALGLVKIGAHEVMDSDLDAPLRRVLRVATEADIERERQNDARAREAMQICRQKVDEHRLPMKLVSAELNFEGSVITFSFTAEGRVDFRALVRDVSKLLRCRVMFYQIGARDHAKSLGGIGVCGLTLCCSSFLTEFKSISMKMAKDQGLFLNPVKFSGVCGKLMCCLEYEQEIYKEGRAKLPQIGETVTTPSGRGRVVDLNIPRASVTVQLEEADSLATHSAAECEWETKFTTACGSSCGGKAGHCGTARKHFRRDEEDEDERDEE